MSKRLLFILLFYAVTLASANAEPREALQYKRTVIREARFVWGLDAPVAVIAAQIEQESSWRPGAKSPFANGLAQFTPDTEEWIKRAYKDRLGGPEGAFNPDWAIRALVTYDKHLYDRVPKAKSEYDRWAFTLASYNGGLGWINRDVRLCGKIPRCDPSVWEDNVELYTNRAAWAALENRNYPSKILRKRQHNYASWGNRIKC